MCKLVNTHYTIFGFCQRCAKIMSEPRGFTPLDTPHNWEKEMPHAIARIAKLKAEMLVLVRSIPKENAILQMPTQRLLTFVLSVNQIHPFYPT